MRVLGRWLLWTLVIAAAAIVLAQGWYATHILWWRTHPPGETAFMAMREAEQREHGKPVHRTYQWVPYERISPALKRAMIAAEDAKFVEHEGFDWEGIQLAMDKNYPQGPRGRRRLDDHAAAREEPLSIVAEELLAQGRGGADHADAGGDFSTSGGSSSSI